MIPPLREAAQRFVTRSRFAARTGESYAQDLAPLLNCLGDRPVTAALTPAAAAAFLAAQDQLAASTYNRRFAALRSLVRWCHQQGWLTDDPLAGLERRTEPRRGPRALDPDQVEAALRAIRDAGSRALMAHLRRRPALSGGAGD
jgi:site-specific recombinase XerD